MTVSEVGLMAGRPILALGGTMHLDIETLAVVSGGLALVGSLLLAGAWTQIVDTPARRAEFPKVHRRPNDFTADAGRLSR